MNTINLPVGQQYFRSIDAAVAWNDLLTGTGNPLGPPPSHRYSSLANHPTHATTYVTPDFGVAIVESAYYAARRLQERIARQFHALRSRSPNLGISYPLRVIDQTVWCFELTSPTQILDLESSRPLRGFLAPNYPPFTLLNPSHVYDATQELGQWVRGRGLHGLQAASVRCPQRGRSVVLFNDVATVVGNVVGSWGLEIEFLDDAGQPITDATREIDWQRPRYRLTPCVSPGATATHQFPAALPAGYQLGDWLPIEIRLA